MKKAYVGYQVYSAREAAAADLLGVLKKLAALGYDGVEFAGFYGHTAEEVKAMLDETGLVAISSHCGIPDTVGEMMELIAFHKKIGCTHIAVPFLDEEHRPGAAGFAGMIEKIYRFGRLCKEAGIQITPEQVMQKARQNEEAYIKLQQGIPCEYERWQILE